MDVTAILDESGNQLFSTATLLKVSTAPSNTYAQHVIEDGTVVADNKIVNQVRMSLTMILDSNDYQSVYKEIQSASNDTTILSIQTRVDTQHNMYIESYPSEESSSMFDTISVTLNLVEQITGIVTTTKLAAKDVANTADVDTESRGEQLPKEDKKTNLQDIAGKVSGLFG